MTIGEILKTKNQDILLSKSILDAIKYKRDCNYIRQLLNSSSEISSEINVNDEDGWTPLMFATDNRDYEIVKLLIDYGADVNAQNDDGQTALMISILNNTNNFPTFNISKILVENGTNINIKDNSGQNALMLAASFDLKDIGEFLFFHNADIRARDNEGNTSFDIARKSWFSKKADFFLREKTIYQKIYEERFDYFLTNVITNPRWGDVYRCSDIKLNFYKKYNYNIDDSDIDLFINKHQEEFFTRQIILKKTDDKIYISPTDSEIENFLTNIITNSIFGDVIDIKALFRERYGCDIDDFSIDLFINSHKEEFFTRQIILKKIDEKIMVCPIGDALHNCLNNLIYNLTWGNINVIEIKTIFKEKYGCDIDDSDIDLSVTSYQKRNFSSNKIIEKNDYIISIYPSDSEIERFLTNIIDNLNFGDEINISKIKEKINKTYQLKLKPVSIYRFVDKHNKNEYFSKSKELKINDDGNYIKIYPSILEIQNFLWSIIKDLKRGDKKEINTIKSDFEKRYFVKLNTETINSYIKLINDEFFLKNNTVVKIIDENYIKIYPSDFEVQNFLLSIIKDLKINDTKEINTIKLDFKKKYFVEIETIDSYVKLINDKNLLKNNTVVKIIGEKLIVRERELNLPSIGTPSYDPIWSAYGGLRR